MSQNANIRPMPNGLESPMASQGQKIITYVLLFGIGTLFLVPFFWMISTSLKTSIEAFSIPIEWIPARPHWGNYVDLFTTVPFAQFLVNSIGIALVSVVGQVLSGSLVAYGFARLSGVGKPILFGLLLSTMMLPSQVTLIPSFLLFRELGWYDTFAPLTVPAWLGTPFYIFMLRQFIMTIPLDYDDAARIDGCSTFGIYWRIILPMLVPALITVSVMVFIGSWNDFMGPLIYLSSIENFTVALGLNLFRTQYTQYWNLTMAASVISLIPCLIIFFSAQKFLIQGFVVDGLK
ncbi:carbohydrate ABC transporter permease [Chloroflexia bacterium SDU3-3]|nr:carbohydrate ABC transporter permease [Chloroflexia bacterium SDU3-3]